jgi:uncharacterized protein YndB with AHSA1/START domain
MTIAPIMHSVRVKADPARAFDLFTTHIGTWWPKGQTVGKNPHAAIIIEPRAGGQWLERDSDGNEVRWGSVLAWEPPSRLLLGWQLSTQWQYDPDLLTEVELTFVPANGGGTIVTLEHRNLERFGAGAAEHAGKLNGGWPKRVADFVDYINTHA